MWSEAEHCQKGSDHVELSDYAEFFRNHAELPPWSEEEAYVKGLKSNYQAAPY